MAPLQAKIPYLASNAVASFDSEDLASGLRYTTFTLSQTTTNASVAYIMNSFNLRSDAFEVLGAHNAEINFDTSEFSAPRRIEGMVYIAGSTETSGSGGTGGSVKYRLLKVGRDGTTETVICGTMTTRATGGDNAVVNYMITSDAVPMTVNAGEKLRVERITQITGGGAGSQYIGTSPLDEDGAVIIPSGDTSTTITRVSIPFPLTE